MKMSLNIKVPLNIKMLLNIRIPLNIKMSLNVKMLILHYMGNHNPYIYPYIKSLFNYNSSCIRVKYEITYFLVT